MSRRRNVQVHTTGMDSGSIRNTMLWSLLILSLPTQNTTARMRAWRALKACGAAVLRDGVYLLPASPEATRVLNEVAADVRQHEGTAHVLPTEAHQTAFDTLFDRAADYRPLRNEVVATHERLNQVAPVEALRHARKLRRAFDAVAAIDFFPGEPQAQMRALLQALESAAERRQAQDEPPSPPSAPTLPRLDRSRYRGRIWATQSRPWIDRLASAWLIRRFIDPEARFLWLPDPAACPRDALGFDFEGATFGHVGGRVTFETLLARFGLETPPLLRLGQIVNALDTATALPAEAPGIERVLAGMRDTLVDDDALLQAAGAVFEGLWSNFESDPPA